MVVISLTLTKASTSAKPISLNEIKAVIDTSFVFFTTYLQFVHYFNELATTTNFQNWSNKIVANIYQYLGDRLVNT